MQRIVIDCDKCGKPVDSELCRFPFSIGDYTDSAGDTDTLDKSIDLCVDCISRQLMLFILALPQQARGKLYTQIFHDKRFYLDHMTPYQHIHGIVP